MTSVVGAPRSSPRPDKSGYASRMSRLSLRDVLFFLFVACCLVAVVWPGFGLDVGTLVLGLPFALTWYIAWVLATFAACVAYELTSPER